MKEIKKYLIDQIENLEKWDENKTLSEYGKGKLSALKDILDQLNIPVVVKSFYCIDKNWANAKEDFDFKKCNKQCEECKAI